MKAGRLRALRDRARARSWAALVTKPQFGDACSYAPDGFVLRSGYRSIADCCEAHDRAYARGGTDADRLDADLRLHRCIRCRVGAARAAVYYALVRLLGWRFWRRRPMRAIVLPLLILAAFGPATSARSQETTPAPVPWPLPLEPRCELVAAVLGDTTGTVNCKGTAVVRWSGPAAPEGELLTIRLDDIELSEFQCTNTVPDYDPSDPSEARTVRLRSAVWGDLTGDGVPELRGDANLDGDVNLFDLLEVQWIILKRSDPTDWTPPE